MNSDKFIAYLQEILSASWKGIKATVKTQLIVMFVTFMILCIGFYIIDVSWWGLKALLIALIDVIPLLGTSIIIVPWAIIHLLIGDQQIAVGLLVIFVIVFVVRQVLEPLINGKSIGVKPLYTFLSTIICTVIFGPWGLVLGSVVAIVIKTVIDIKRRDF